MVVREQLNTTARQYGEVVLADAASGQSPGTLDSLKSRCKEGMAHFLPSRYNFYWEQARSRYRFNKLTNCSPGAVYRRKEKRAFRPIVPLQFLPRWHRVSPAKSVTNNLPILSVAAGLILKLSRLQKLSR